MVEIDWIRRARQRDHGAVQELVDAHREAIFRLAYLITGDAEDAEDVAQETFIRAINTLGRFDDSRAFRPWLCSIAVNLSRNRLRSIKRYWAALRRFASQESGLSPTIETQTAQQVEALDLWRAVRKLKAAEQEIIYLRYFLELSTEETAQALNIQPGTVKSRLHRALKRLRQVIESDFPHLTEGRIDHVGSF